MFGRKIAHAYVQVKRRGRPPGGDFANAPSAAQNGVSPARDASANHNKAGKFSGRRFIPQTPKRRARRVSVAVGVDESAKPGFVWVGGRVNVVPMQRQPGFES